VGEKQKESAIFLVQALLKEDIKQFVRYEKGYSHFLPEMKMSLVPLPTNLYRP